VAPKAKRLAGYNLLRRRIHLVFTADVKHVRAAGDENDPFMARMKKAASKPDAAFS
jgi:hypothetical protein